MWLFREGSRRFPDGKHGRAALHDQFLVSKVGQCGGDTAVSRDAAGVDICAIGPVFGNKLAEDKSIFIINADCCPSACCPCDRERFPGAVGSENCRRSVRLRPKTDIHAIDITGSFIQAYGD